MSDSLGMILGLGKGSVESIGGSIGTVLGKGIGSLSEALTPLLDGLATASLVPEPEPK